ncbi:MAG: hypothetical protein HYX48_00100 [Chlamydiales bacterium]|nr:hypothetical protein [Chlamydiales bacterium]
MSGRPGESFALRERGRSGTGTGTDTFTKERRRSDSLFFLACQHPIFIFSSRSPVPPFVNVPVCVPAPDLLFLFVA